MGQNWAVQAEELLTTHNNSEVGHNSDGEEEHVHSTSSGIDDVESMDPSSENQSQDWDMAMLEKDMDDQDDEVDKVCRLSCPTQRHKMNAIFSTTH
jgi:hypothetical protein